MHLALTIAVALFGAASPPPEPAEVDLAAHRWEKRILLVFAPSPEHEGHKQQEAALKAQADGLKERHMLVFRLFEDGQSFSGQGPVTAASRERLAAKHEVDGPTAILIGKDGGVKLRRKLPVPMDDIFALIDTMPMRRQEMREQE